MGRELRRLLLAHHDSGEIWSPEAELLLFYADRAEHLATLVWPSLAAGKVVLVDRFEDSSWAYQGARGISDAKLSNLRDVVLGDFRPDLTLILDMDPEESLERVKARNAILGASFNERRFDQEALEPPEGQAPLPGNRSDRTRFVLVPASGTFEQVEAEVWSRVSPSFTTVDSEWSDVRPLPQGPCSGPAALAGAP